MSTKTYALDRQHFLDALRGFALFGILIVNISAFASAYYASGLPNPMRHSSLDQVLSFLVSALFETKFYLLFSFLFGYSFSIQMLSAQQKKNPFKVFFLRRLLGLFSVGLLHALLLYHGDILMVYAVMGLLLLGLRHRSDRFLIGFALGLILLTTFIWLFIAWATAPISDPTVLWLKIQSVQQQYLGGWTEIMAQHWAELQLIWIITLIMQAPVALAMFCFGFIAGRSQLFLNLDQYQPYLQQVLLLGCSVALPVALFYGYASTFQAGSAIEIFALALSVLIGALLSAMYILCLLKLYQSQSLTPVFTLLSSAGRMALSNYIVQSIICTYLFFGVGFGWMGQVTPSQTLLIAVSIFILQCIYSRLWLHFFAYGPLEWLLRCFTHFKVLPLLRTRLCKTKL